MGPGCGQDSAGCHLLTLPDCLYPLVNSPRKWDFYWFSVWILGADLGANSRLGATLGAIKYLILSAIVR